MMSRLWREDCAKIRSAVRLAPVRGCFFGAAVFTGMVRRWVGLGEAVSEHRPSFGK